jgi:hypothetical protein
MFKHWAQPVVRKRWALAALFLHWIARHTRYRFGKGHHAAWERAVGVR